MTGKPPADIFDLAASTKDPNSVYAATRAGLMISRDAGRTWQAASMVQRPATMVATTPDGTVYAFQVGVGLLKSNEPSLAWQTVGNSFGDAVLLHFAVDPHQCRAALRRYRQERHSCQSGRWKNLETAAVVTPVGAGNIISRPSNRWKVEPGLCDLRLGWKASGPPTPSMRKERK